MRLIDADALLEKKQERDCCFTVTEWDILNAPTVVPVKHGKWEEFDCDYGGTPDVGYYCSECGHAEMTKYPYCNCGARMEVSR